MASLTLVHPVPAARPGRSPERSTPQLASQPARPAPSGGLRLTRRGRVVLAVVAVLSVLAGLVLGAGAAFGGTAQGERATVVVRPGDTLWSIARTVGADSDPRAVIAEVRALNGLPDDATLRPGQRLVVPAA